MDKIKRKDKGGSDVQESKTTRNLFDLNDKGGCGSKACRGWPKVITCAYLGQVKVLTSHTYIGKQKL